MGGYGVPPRLDQGWFHPSSRSCRWRWALLVPMEGGAGDAVATEPPHARALLKQGGCGGGGGLR